MRRSITYSALAGLAIVAVVVVIVAIGGGGDDDNGNASAANMGAGSGLVSVQNVDRARPGRLRGQDALQRRRGEESDPLHRGLTSFWDAVDASANQAKSASSDLDLDFGVVKRPTARAS